MPDQRSPISQAPGTFGSKSSRALTIIWALAICGLTASTLVASDVQQRVSIRDDVEDSEYVTLGRPYEALGRVLSGNRRCTGTLVRTTDGTTKLLAAAHCFDWNSDNESEVLPSSVTFETGVELDGPSVVATDIQVQSWSAAGGLDIAVITLSDFPPEDAPIPLTVSSAKPVGEEVTMVGHGTHGTGLPPFDNSIDDLRRAATNMLDEVFEEGENVGQFRFDFDHPNNPAFSTMGGSAPTALEGTSGIGDSGGPLLYKDQVVAILHGGINPTAFGFSEYGDVSIYAGVFHPPNLSFLRANNILVVGEGGPATTVNVDSIAQPGQRFVATENGNPLKDASRVRIGTFPTGFDPAAADLRAIARAWLPFGETEVRTIAGEPGRFSGNCSADGTDFANAKIYWWILETISGPPAPDLGNVTAWGLFSSSKSGWTFPALNLPPPSNATLISSSEVDEATGDAGILEDRLVLTSVAVVIDFETWAAGAFSAEVPDELRTQSADPDSDGLSNEMEWVIGTSPVMPDPDQPLRIESSDSKITIRYDRRRFLPADTHRLETSSNLINWESAFALSTTVEETNQETESVASVFTQLSPTRYWRLTLD